MRGLFGVGGVGCACLAIGAAVMLLGGTDRDLYGWETAQVRGATAGNPFCIGCATKPLAGNCSGSDPCHCTTIVYSMIADPSCANMSILFKGLNPAEIDEANIDEDDDSIQVKESRECRLEYECDPGTVVNFVDCDEDDECTHQNLLTECRPCYRGSQTDTVSMPKHYCVACPD